MTKHNKVQIFNEQKVRTIWDSEQEKWYFSVVDTIAILIDTDNPRRYLSDLKRKLKREGSEVYENIVQLKLEAPDGKMRLTDVADQQQLFRIIQSIPSPKAEPFKQWMAQIASDRIDQIQDPELSINQAVADYRRLGYSEEWINQRIKGIEVRKLLTDEWKRRGVTEKQYGLLTDIITKQWSGMTTKEYKGHKGLRKENLRDNMTNIE
ncbi:MAG: Bro-N domain-containing protein, partial [Muribaculaceae bacterium]|nr:Bro-N domain-containing protein [Muribaculaceae bacterium]